MRYAVLAGVLVIGVAGCAAKSPLEVASETCRQPAGFAYDPKAFDQCMSWALPMAQSQAAIDARERQARQARAAAILSAMPPPVYAAPVQVYVPPAPRVTNCRNIGGGNMQCMTY